jgi:hypothetical protein
MEIRKDILQKFIDEDGNYLICQRYIEHYGRCENEFQAVFVSPNIDRELWGKKIGELSFDTVYGFAKKAIITNIHLGGTYQPFQHGILYGDFVFAEKLTCNANRLIHACYEEEITDYYKVLEKMKQFTDVAGDIKS